MSEVQADKLVSSNGSGAPDAPNGLTFNSGSSILNNYVAWTAYTPTISGFGSESSVTFQYRRVGNTLDIMGKFVSGTAAASEAQIGLPSGMSVDFLSISGANLCGQVGIDVNTNQIFFSLATDADTYINVSRIIPAASSDFLTPINGNSVSAVGDVVSINASLPITS
jgi:hypothetical protein